MRIRATLVVIPALLLAVGGASPPQETAVLAGGCFWGVQNLFEHVRGVTTATSGFAGGAESVRIGYDPSVVSYQTLLRVFFTVAHDPTQLNRQGPDVGSQYRSVVFYANESQQRIARGVIDSLTRARAWPAPIVTQVTALASFQVAPPEHQDYAIKHPRDPYIVINDLPKLEQLRQRFPELFREEPVLYGTR